MPTKSELGQEDTTIGAYILIRLAQLGLKQVHGVPGDSNLRFLDLIEDHPDLDWVGCCNELNASYAADGYARVSKAGFGCLVTTFGVGELSAINGIAGAYAEQIPILHIVGVPSTALQAKNPVVHHSMGDRKFDTYAKISDFVTCASSLLNPPENAPDEIDRLLKAALTECRPVYLSLANNLVDEKIPSSNLRIDLRQKVFEESQLQLNPESVHRLLDHMSELFLASKNPIVLLDGKCDPFRIQSEAIRLAESIQAPVFTTFMAKTAIGADHPLFGGLYKGSLSDSHVIQQVESSDMVIWIGPVASDFNTASFSFNFEASEKVEFHASHTVIGDKEYSSIGFRILLPILTERLSSLPQKPKRALRDHNLPTKISQQKSINNMITQDEFWPLWAENFFEPNDIILGEAGTSMFGLLDVKFPDGARYLFQLLWASIGWSTGACLGAAQAAAEQGKRTILFIGDGSLQISVQEISTMIRAGVKPIIVVLNNDGYVVERLIHGMTRKYNDIQPWKWTGILDLFNPENTTPTASYMVETREEFEKLLKDPKFRKADRIQLVEVKLGREDGPAGMVKQIQALHGKTWD
ncbi:thiamine diphosphate-binding protein [Melampsora americana]|nr:thiamine diphosphate-binding protein [Melampsora americana]